MKTTTLLLLTAACALAQGPESPPGAPGPTQKSLQEIWDRIGLLEAANADIALRSQELRNAYLSLQAASTRNSASLLATLDALGVRQPWVTTAIPGVADATAASLAYSPAGFPAIAWFDTSVADLMFASFNGVAWTVSTVESTGNTGRDPSLAWDHDGNPAIAFTRGSDLVYTVRVDGVWLHETVASGTGGNHYPSLAFTNTNHAVVCFSHVGNDSLRLADRYATEDGYAWDTHVIQASASGAIASSLVLGPDNSAHIAFQTLSPPSLNYGYLAAGYTSAPSVSAFTLQAHANPSITLGPLGLPRISAYDTTADDLIVYTFDGIMLWENTTVDGATSDAGLFSSIATSPLGMPNVAYFDSSSETVKFTRFDGLAWSAETIASAIPGNALSSVSLKFGPDGRPGIAVAGGGNLFFITTGPFPTP